MPTNNNRCPWLFTSIHKSKARHLFVHQYHWIATINCPLYSPFQLQLNSGQIKSSDSPTNGAKIKTHSKRCHWCHFPYVSLTSLLRKFPNKGFEYGTVYNREGIHGANFGSTMSLVVNRKKGRLKVYQPAFNLDWFRNNELFVRGITFSEYWSCAKGINNKRGGEES